MAKDAELDRLKAVQDRAYQRKQDAYQAQQNAWDRRSAARDAMNRAYNAKQQAYDEQDRAWQQLQRLRDSHGPRIGSLNSMQETAFQNMQRAFANASSAHDRRDGASARSYADEGHRYKGESQGYVSERRQLIGELRSAKAEHDATRPAFERAKNEFTSCKRAFDQAKAEHERAQANFKQAKRDFDEAVKAFKARLDHVKSQGKKRRDDKSALAAKAGVPYRYRDNVWVSTDSDGNTNIYFGGVGEPNGPGHGHYVLDRNGKVTYKRDPYDPHGSHNFTESDDTRGSTLYDRSARSQDMRGFSTRDNDTRQSESSGGTFYNRDRDVDLHVTQYYDDNTRLSWDTDGKTDRDRHWTNQNLPSGHPDRHAEPDDTH